MRLDAAAFASALSFKERAALLGQFPVPVSPARTDLHRHGIVDQFGNLTKPLGDAVVRALQSKPQVKRAHKYDAKACFITPDLRTMPAKRVLEFSGEVVKVDPEPGWERFDSMREARRYITLVMLQRAGQITELQRQVPFPLFVVTTNGERRQISKFIADFVYVRAGQRVVEDAKGVRTREFILKRKWLKVQEGIDIVEV